MRPRKVPLRKCVACQEMMPKKELIRIVRAPSGEVAIDLTGKKAGRGAYLCGKVSCFKLAKKTKALDRALKQSVGDDIYDALEKEFVAVEEQFIAAKELESDDEEA
ncbi:RNase P modulator RnpM [Paenibacillus sp. PAMC21692]|uniref:RNase P modulator RnpM n=1 Tax=Paenibacillus sp. PAMC21692 TaxID=2762320 RepID=UPI00164D42D7|nr:YlxR family protein [Paenibacillus sp. PAMC21692]QNK54800.1 YlxR family protein [Paenibacillus sp. PAMC21692]